MVETLGFRKVRGFSSLGEEIFDSQEGLCIIELVQWNLPVMEPHYSSSSVGATARCGLWPVEQYLSILPYLSPTLSIISLPALEDLFLLVLLLYVLSWVFLFVSSLPVLEWRSFWASYPPPILSRWPSQLILCPFIHFTIFSPLFNSSSSRFVLIFHYPSSYLGPNIFQKMEPHWTVIFPLLSSLFNRGTWSKGKDKVHPRTGYEGPEGALDGGGCLTPRPGRFTPGKDPVPIV